MSKRRLENEIDERSDAILGDLEPDQRLQLLLRARANGNEQRIDRLVETCPQYRYTAADHAFTDRVQWAHRIASNAIYDLHTTYLQYALTKQQQRYTWVLDYERDEEPSDEKLDRASERADELRELFATLYTNYHAYQRFATEILNVDPKTWLALHPEGPTVFEVVADVIDDQLEIELAESHLNGLLEEDEEEEADKEIADPDQTAPDNDREVTLEDVAEIRYEALASIWEDAIAETPDREHSDSHNPSETIEDAVKHASDGTDRCDSPSTAMSWSPPTVPAPVIQSRADSCPARRSPWRAMRSLSLTLGPSGSMLPHRT